MTVAALAPGIEPLARAFPLALAAKHRRIQTQGVQDAIGPQPLAAGETLRPRHHRHRKRRERMGQRDGIVGSRLGKGQMLWHLPGETNPAREENGTGQTAEE